MTIRQKILKQLYPAMMWFTRNSGINNTSLANKTASGNTSFHSLTGVLTNGGKLDLNDFKGKKVLLVNTASDCGYTGQYEGLEKLYNTNKEKLVVLGFPANDFKEQEKGKDEEIAAFCKLNYGVSFPLMQKSKVVKGNGQNNIFNWLTTPEKNGWNEQAPTWNFCKYLVDEEGRLIHFFGPSIEPLSSEITNVLSK